MPDVTVRFLGSGDAFGTGGRLPTCIHLDHPGGQVLIDCGGAVLASLSRAGLAPVAIDTIFLTHLHGDQFAGVPFVILEACFVSQRSNPLVIAGPPDVESRVRQTLELLFPGAGAYVDERMTLRFVELVERRPTPLGPSTVEAYPVVHPSGSTSFGLRVTVAGKTVAYSGDTEWTDALVDLAHEADLFICECYSFETVVPYHLSYRTLQDRLPRLSAKRLILTHLGREMFAHRPQIDLECADDGQRLVV